MSKIKVVHYINQFFAQIGGEEKADYPAEIRVGEVVGPGLALTQNFKDEAEIIATVICGDSYFNENLEKAKADILAMVKEQAPDVFIAGPAFNAGRYGGLRYNCGSCSGGTWNSCSYRYVCRKPWSRYVQE